MIEHEINTEAIDCAKDIVKDLKYRSKGFAKGVVKTQSWEEIFILMMLTT
jgi:hypothetical protein